MAKRRREGGMMVVEVDEETAGLSDVPDDRLSDLEDEEEEIIGSDQMKTGFYLVQDIRSGTINGSWLTTHETLPNLIGELSYDGQHSPDFHLRVELIPVNSEFRWAPGETYVQPGSSPGRLILGYHHDGSYIDLVDEEMGS